MNIYCLFFFFWHLWLWQVKKLQLEPFYATWGKKDWVQGQWQKKLMMWKTQEWSMNVWPKIGLDVSRKVIPASKTNQSQGDLLLWKMTPSLKWLNFSLIQTLIHCQQDLFLHWAHHQLIPSVVKDDALLKMAEQQLSLALMYIVGRTWSLQTDA